MFYKLLKNVKKPLKTCEEAAEKKPRSCSKHVKKLLKACEEAARSV